MSDERNIDVAEPKHMAEPPAHMAPSSQVEESHSAPSMLEPELLSPNYQAEAYAGTPNPEEQISSPEHFAPSFEPATQDIEPEYQNNAEQSVSMPSFLSQQDEVFVPAVPDLSEPTSPETTAEIDIAAVEAQLQDPGSTQSFAPVTEDLIDTDATYDAGTSSALMWGARSDVGCVRNHNEDSYLVASPLFAVCDGMGGHAAGEVASAIAVETIARMAPKSADAARLGAAIEAANAAIIEAAENGVGRAGMGCTATAAYIEGTTLAIAHVGDSRAYLMHEGTLIRITRDHSFVEELVDAGEITADEARIHPNRSVITRALGSDPAMYADHFTINIQEGDRLILCSDGLSSMIPDGEIEHIATKSSTAQICTDNLVDAALAAGGGDNVTVLVIDVTDDGHRHEVHKQRRRLALYIALGVVTALIIAGFVSFNSITHSVYLGAKDGTVAVYRGVPDTFFGFKLNWLEDETSVLLSDLPADTQQRLLEGIPQKDLDTANATVSSYRAQIDEALSKKAEDAKTIKENTDEGPDLDSEMTDGSKNVSSPASYNSTDAPASSFASTNPANSVADSNASTMGGTA